MVYPPSTFSKLAYGILAFALSLSSLSCSTSRTGGASSASEPTITHVADGWANNSVNVVAFRKNSLVTFKGTQYTAWYGADRSVMLAKRKSGAATWEIQKTNFTGNAADAHNTISLMVDGNGFLHLSWDHHNNPLNYARSVSPGSLQMTEKMPMTGQREKVISYPEFYRLPSGNLMFFYRDGGSGQGNLVINSYDTGTQQWTQLHSNLINGEGKRNAYWQAYLDKNGTLHVSWVWRESPDVASNHDLAYARSLDGGKTWEKSTGEKYTLPITEATAEKALAIPQNSELINQTSMAADEQGNPFIATYWREAGSTIPQYHLVYHDGKTWQKLELDFRKTPFSLSGVGTKRIPIARPQIMVKNAGAKASVLMIFRDEERGSKASALIINKLSDPKWTILDLTPGSLGSWEPTYDTELWKEKQILNLFVQKVEQVDGEGRATIPPQPIQVIEWKPKF
ncbi:BNR repeat-containing protein [Rufibacter sediminis]|uniref:BNR-4 repeat-containing protein n=1 Tax=Rufibacter sediminis TaxID=2762756 RepID=A0ABR6VPQ2_9BACT|nr:BNR repeat-containing protein [Rufibacter sediminis]MBC3539140.1 BNR-4 repeat-containing protein [Rufibacter sediminis]